MEFVIGILAGGLLVWIFGRRKPSGTFIIDFSDLDKDFCTLNLDESLNDVYSKKYIVLRVKTIDYNSQK